MPISNNQILKRIYDPEYKEALKRISQRYRDKIKLRCENDPEFKEWYYSRNKAYYHNKYKDDPDFVSKRKEYEKEYNLTRRKPATPKPKPMFVDVKRGSFILTFD